MAKILIIDDDPMLVQDMKLFLEEVSGHQVETAPSGEEGIKKVGDIKPDLILLDLMLPGIDGFDVAREIRKNQETQKIPILMLSGVKSEMNIMGLDFEKQAGAGDWLPINDYIDKPISLDIMNSKIDHLLSKTKKSQKISK
ncbi:MAG: response regulator [Candidatus Omnitrophica bacterium]|nr:response regulator [Candidatus Omnitrophota bacterium]